MAIGLCNCTVYTINKSDLENTLKPKENVHSSRGLNMYIAMLSKNYINAIDTLKCADPVGQIKTKRFKYDSKITVVTHQKKKIKFYAKTLYIWRGEYLIGELASLNIYGTNYFPVKLCDISRIEVRGTSFNLKAKSKNSKLPVAN